MKRTLEEMLIADNKKLREAGCDLAEASINVIKTYDGVHRLSLAVAKWSKAIANEGDRDLLYSPQKPFINFDPLAEAPKCTIPDSDHSKECHAFNGGLCMNAFQCDILQSDCHKINDPETKDTQDEVKI